MNNALQVVKFSAFNNQTAVREEYRCNFLPGIHSSRNDAAESCLWYGQCWSRGQMHSADIKIQE